MRTRWAIYNILLYGREKYAFITNSAGIFRKQSGHPGASPKGPPPQRGGDRGGITTKTTSPPPTLARRQPKRSSPSTRGRQRGYHDQNDVTAAISLVRGRYTYWPAGALHLFCGETVPIPATRGLVQSHTTETQRQMRQT